LTQVVLVVVLVVVVVVLVGGEPPNPVCQSVDHWTPSWPATGTATADEASSSTRLLRPDGEGRWSVLLTRLSAAPSPFGPQPDAPGTANGLSPWTAPATKIAPIVPFGSGVPSGSNIMKLALAPARLVTSGIRTIGF